MSHYFTIIVYIHNQKLNEPKSKWTCEKLFFSHIVTSCNTNSAFHGIEKKTLNPFVKNEDFENITNVFMKPNATQSHVEKACERAASIMYK